MTAQVTPPPRRRRRRVVVNDLARPAGYDAAPLRLQAAFDEAYRAMTAAQEAYQAAYWAGGGQGGRRTRASWATYTAAFEEYDRAREAFTAPVPFQGNPVLREAVQTLLAIADQGLDDSSRPAVRDLATRAMRALDGTPEDEASRPHPDTGSGTGACEHQGTAGQPSDLTQDEALHLLLIAVVLEPAAGPRPAPLSGAISRTGPPYVRLYRADDTAAGELLAAVRGLHEAVLPFQDVWDDDLADAFAALARLGALQAPGEAPDSGARGRRPHKVTRARGTARSAS